ncbi:hypothetical protein SAMN05878281_1451 [Salegentibacter salegens]|uniref:Uncharacterized protein n=1 Tax=Salegentibacter salegens TaxID=143223 RepID=A0A1M7KIV4_9FLAO|nr:hypothetical protein LY58_01100 [Salegentibacter salegens]SHM65317.1 hypothetical protein SAMN05878281_1451 [Salegentibacter salegens]
MSKLNERPIFIGRSSSAQYNIFQAFIIAEAALKPVNYYKKDMKKATSS